MSPRGAEPLRIIHCVRSPVGGIFRHVRDLAIEQTAAGHSVGVICDNNTGGAFEEKILADLKPSLKLGLHRMSIQRSIGPSDIFVARKMYKILKPMGIDIVHTHGAKCGALGRLVGSALGKPKRFYCPHGGSIHYDAGSVSGRLYFRLERFLERFTDGIVFVSEYERDGYRSKVGVPKCATTLVYNGLQSHEFEPVADHEDCSDFVYIGVMRDLKGVDILLDAIPLVSQAMGRPITVTLVGDGGDLATYKARTQNQSNIRFFEPTPAHDAFCMGKTLVIPSRAESLPYILLEALAAQRRVIATRVGGIPEIYSTQDNLLVSPGDAEALSEAMIAELSGQLHLPNPEKMAAYVKEHFSTQTMSAGIMNFYREILGK